MNLKKTEALLFMCLLDLLKYLSSTCFQTKYETVDINNSAYMNEFKHRKTNINSFHFELNFMMMMMMIFIRMSAFKFEELRNHLKLLHKPNNMFMKLLLLEKVPYILIISCLRWLNELKTTGKNYTQIIALNLKNHQLKFVEIADTLGISKGQRKLGTKKQWKRYDGCQDSNRLPTERIHVLESIEFLIAVLIQYSIENQPTTCKRINSINKMFKFLIIISMLSLWHCEFGAPSSLLLYASNADILNEDQMDFVHLALNLTKKFIIQRTNTLVIIEKCGFFCRAEKWIHIAMVEEFLYNIHGSSRVQLGLGKSDERPWDYNIFIVDSYLGFKSMHVSIPETDQEREYYFFILLTWSPPGYDTLYYQLKSIFRMCISLNVKNVVIMHKFHYHDFTAFYTYQTFSPEYCQRIVTIEEINRYENGQLKWDYLFPGVLENFHGCPVTVSGHLIEPLLTFDGDINNRAHVRDLRRIGGIEGDIIKLVAHTMNMTLKLRFAKKLNEHRMFSNASKSFRDTYCNSIRYNHYSLFQLRDDRAQIAIGGLSPILPDAYKFTCSITYHSTPAVFVVKKGLLFGPITLLLTPLRPRTWLMILTTLFLTIVLIQIINHFAKPMVRKFIFGSRNRYPIRNMVISFLGYSVPMIIVPTRNFARFLFMAWLILTFELRNAYQGKLFDSLSFPKRLPIPGNIEELIDSNYKLLAPVVTNFYPANKTSIVRSTVRALNLVNRSEKRLTTMTLLDYFINYNYKNIQTSSLTYVDDTIYMYQCVMFFKKHSILPASFNKRLKRLYDAGVTSYVAQRNMRWKKNIRSNSPRRSDVTMITNKNLRGIYIVYGCGYALALLAFILEMVSKYSRNLTHFMDGLH
ncbi:uncharacterized protein LOC142240115 [Haematobia irritans]|uniref:uncharacterized protein LOC142240115 n=1 Tax=Haematobia irritans TaxID=7368 RepID=UPI003F50B54D